MVQARDYPSLGTRPLNAFGCNGHRSLCPVLSCLFVCFCAMAASVTISPLTMEGPFPSMRTRTVRERLPEHAPNLVSSLDQIFRARPEIRRNRNWTLFLLVLQLLHTHAAPSFPAVADAIGSQGHMQKCLVEGKFLAKELTVDIMRLVYIPGY